MQPFLTPFPDPMSPYQMTAMSSPGIKAPRSLSCTCHRNARNCHIKAWMLSPLEEARTMNVHFMLVVLQFLMHLVGEAGM